MGLKLVMQGGTTQEAWMYWRACAQVPGLELLGVCSSPNTAAEARARRWQVREFSSMDHVLQSGEPQALLLLEPSAERTRQALAALSRGLHVLLSPPLAPTVEEAQTLLQAAARAKGRLVCLEPWLHYPPFEKLEALVNQEELGRIQLIHQRSLLAGQGGFSPALNPTFEQEVSGPAGFSPETLPRELFEKLSLAVRLRGRVASLAFLPGARGASSTSVLSFRFARPGCYGVVEVTCAQDLHIPSAYEARDDKLELTGSHGVLWLTRGPAQARTEPALRLYRGENLLTWENLPDDWALAYPRALQAFVDDVKGHRRDSADLARALHVTQALSIAHAGRNGSQDVPPLA